LCFADPFFRIELPPEARRYGLPKIESGGLPISRAMLDPTIFLRLKDSIIDQIANTIDPNLAPARRAIERLNARDLYKCVANQRINMNDPDEEQLWELNSEKDILEDIIAIGGKHDDGTREILLEAQDLIVKKNCIHHGQKNKNPVSFMRFLPKSLESKLTNPIDALPEAVQIDESDYLAHLPRVYQENSIRLFCRDSAKADLARHVFSLWWGEIKEEMHTTPDAGREPVLLTQESEYGEYSPGRPAKGRSSIISPPFQKPSFDEDDD
jgi:hypothetical protein